MLIGRTSSLLRSSNPSPQVRVPSIPIDEADWRSGISLIITSVVSINGPMEAAFCNAVWVGAPPSV
jgi:hypothetical protein